MTLSSPGISIVVPVYNSEGIIPELVLRIKEVFSSGALSYEIILCDDGSTDNSWQVIKEVCRKDKRIIGLKLGKNRGQWCSTLAGISRASGQYIVTIDDDLEYEPADILKLYERINSGDYQVVFGMAKHKYHTQGKNQRFATLRNRLLNRLWHKKLTDSFRIFNRKLVFKDDTFLLTEPFEVFIANNLDGAFWGYCDVQSHKRHSGKSNHSFIKKLGLVLLYSSYYLTYPVKSILLMAIVFLATICVIAPLFVQPNLPAPFSLSIRIVVFLTGLLLATLLIRAFLQTKKFQPEFIAEQLNTSNIQPERSPITIQ